MKSLFKFLAASPLNDLRKWLIGYAKGSFSQGGEDTIVSSILGSKQGLYVDIGANHPFKLSNTYLFYRRGWNGICIEPMPFMYARLQKWRPRDTHLNIGIGTVEGSLEFYVMNPHVLSTFSPEVKENLLRTGAARLTGTNTIPIQTMASVFEQHVANQPIDLLSVDTEGRDFDVLQSNNWERWRPRVILIEKVSPGSHGDASAIEDFLQSKGYRKHASTKHNDIFVTKT